MQLLRLFALLAFTLALCEAKTVLPIEKALVVFKERLPILEETINNNTKYNLTSEIVMNITSRGYANFTQSTEFQRLEMLEEEFYYDFLTDFLAYQEVQGDVLAEMRRSLLSVLSTDGEWVPFKFIFSDKKSGSANGGLGFILIFVQRIGDQKVLNFISTRTVTSFKTFPDLIVIKRTNTTLGGLIVKEETIVQKEERFVSEADLISLFNFFELISIKKILEYIPVKSFSKALVKYNSHKSQSGHRGQIAVYTPKRGNHLRHLQATAFITGIVGNINMVTTAWQVITSLFSTKKTLVLKDIINRQGYDRFISNSLTTSIDGLEAAFIGEFLDDFKEIVSLPHDPNLRDTLLNSIKYTKYSQSRAFQGNSVSFAKNNGGTTTFVTFLHQKDRETNTYNIIYSYFSAEFSLAPDIWVWNKGISYFGGIYANSKDFAEFRPRSVTNADIEGIVAFMEMMCFRGIYSYLGVPNLPLPPA